MAKIDFDYNKKIITITHFISCGNFKPIKNGIIIVHSGDKFPKDVWEELSKSQQEDVTWFFIDCISD